VSAKPPVSVLGPGHRTSFGRTCFSNLHPQHPGAAQEVKSCLHTRWYPLMHPPLTLCDEALCRPEIRLPSRSPFQAQRCALLHVFESHPREQPDSCGSTWAKTTIMSSG
jgi:hypothetical protein